MQIRPLDLDGTGKSLSEVLIFASTNPQYDERLFIELQVQYMKIPSSSLGLHVVYRNCFWHSEQFLYTTCSPHVLQKEELLTKIYLYCIYHLSIYLLKWTEFLFWKLLTCSLVGNLFIGKLGNFEPKRGWTSFDLGLGINWFIISFK